MIFAPIKPQNFTPEIGFIWTDLGGILLHLLKGFDCS